VAHLLVNLGKPNARQIHVSFGQFYVSFGQFYVSLLLVLVEFHVSFGQFLPTGHDSSKYTTTVFTASYLIIPFLQPPRRALF
jgi:hypothetical protein